MKIFTCAEKIIKKPNNEGNVPSFEVVEVVLVQCKLVDN